MPAPIERLEHRRLLATFSPTQLGGLGFDGDTSIALADDGSVTVGGQFSGTVDFSPTATTVERTAAGATDAFVARYSPNGVLLWVYTFGGDLDSDRLDELDELDRPIAPFRLGTGPLPLGRSVRGPQELVTDLAIDGDGNTYVGGAFRGVVDFGDETRVGGVDGPGVDPLEFFDGLLLKLDAAGDLQWVRQITGPFDEVVTGVDVMADGTPVAGGSFAREARFADSPRARRFEPEAREDGFVATFRPDTGGPIDVVPVGGEAEQAPLRDQVADVAATPDGGVVAVGTFAGRADVSFGDTPAVLETFDDGSGLTDGFTLKLDAGLSLEWAESFGGDDFDGNVKVAVNDEGAIFTAGYFQQVAEVAAGGERIEANEEDDDDHTDLLVRRLEADGSLTWASHLPGTGLEVAHALEADGEGNVILAGGFFGRLDVAPGPAEVTLRGTVAPDDFEAFNSGDRDAQSYDGFAVKLSLRGRFVTAYDLDGLGDSYLTGLAIDEARDKLYVTGHYNENRRRGGADLNNTSRTLPFETEEGAQALIFTLGLDTLTLV